MKLVFEDKKRMDESDEITSMSTIMKYLKKGYEINYNYRPGWAYLYNPNDSSEDAIGIRYDVAEKLVTKYKDQLYRTKGASSEYNFLFGLKEDLSESEKRMNEDVSDSIMQGRLSLFKYLNRLDLGHSLSRVEDEPDLPLNSFGQAVYANEYEAMEELKAIQDPDVRKILLDIFHYLIKDWWTADDVYFYKNEETYNLLAKRYGWDY